MMLLFSEDRVEELRPKVRFRIAHQVGWACADLEDLVQETLTRLLLAVRQNKVRDPAGMGGFLNGICRNVVFEYRRRLLRDDMVPEMLPDPADKRLSGAEQFEIRHAIALALAQLSPRDREILRAFYIDQASKQQMLESFSVSYEQLRVVLCRAKVRFRAIYTRGVQQTAFSGHPGL
jgi:RNA polymerase sigma factor (sigma-70 family)